MFEGLRSRWMIALLVRGHREPRTIWDPRRTHLRLGQRSAAKRVLERQTLHQLHHQEVASPFAESKS